MENTPIATNAGGPPALPRYKSHKVVGAAKILNISNFGIYYHLHLEGVGEWVVTEKWFEKHNPQVGGYLVEYGDGYKSFSPAQAFEDGYTPIEAPMSTIRSGPLAELSEQSVKKLWMMGAITGAESKGKRVDVVALEAVYPGWEKARYEIAAGENVSRWMEFEITGRSVVEDLMKDIPEDEVAVELHRTTDAKVWTREFLKIAGGFGVAGADGKPLDEEWILGWFANAIMCGTDHQRWAIEKTAKEGEYSDGFHTFNELYEHRYALFVAWMNTELGYCPDPENQEFAWISKEHHEKGTMFPGYFIAGLNLTHEGPITYHLPEKFWEIMVEMGAKVLDAAPEWDGHTSDDVLKRIMSFVTEIPVPETDTTAVESV